MTLHEQGFHSLPILAYVPHLYRCLLLCLLQNGHGQWFGEMLLAFLWKNAPKGLWGILNKRFHPARNPSGFPKIGAGRLIPVSMNVVWHMPLTRQGQHACG